MVFINCLLINYLANQIALTSSNWSGRYGKGSCEYCSYPMKYICTIINLKKHNQFLQCTIASKINSTPKGVYLPISKLHSILAVVNLLAHNNITINCYGQVN